jgi:hypothetical protein
MGRTVSPYSWQIERLRERFRKFRRALRREDQRLFDDLMLFAKLHVQAGVMASSPNPADSVFLSILIEQQRLLLGHTRELERLRGELHTLKERLREGINRDDDPDRDAL